MRHGEDSVVVEALLAEFRELLGSEAVLTDVEEFCDPYDPTDLAHRPAAVVQPASVGEVQAIVRAAARYGVPIWVSSQGRNNGYGGSAPVLAGSVVVNLRRMNRILEVNERLGYVVVEPGVRFFDLVDHAEATGGAWWPSTPSLGWGSVVGNTVDHGFGSTEFGDHAAAVAGLEVVLPDGSLLRTGMWASSTSTSYGTHPRGFGPNITPMFMQSNLGIVTKLARWVSPRPESYAAVTAHADDPDALAPLIDATELLVQEHTVRNIPNLTTSLGAAAMRAPRSHWTRAGVPMPDEDYRALCAALGTGWYNLRLALYGPSAVVDAQLDRVRTVLSSAVPGVRISVNRIRGEDVSDETVRTHADRVQAGRPSMMMLETAKWWSDDGGHLELAPIAPATGADAVRIADLLRPRLEAEGFDFWPSLYISGRSLMFLAVMNFDRHDPSRVQAAYRVAEGAIPALAEAGYSLYRGNIRHMDLIQSTYDFGDHAYRRFVEGIKDLLDPVGILAPGKQGIWPTRYRPEHRD